MRKRSVAYIGSDEAKRTEIISCMEIVYGARYDSSYDNILKFDMKYLSRLSIVIESI